MRDLDVPRLGAPISRVNRTVRRCAATMTGSAPRGRDGGHRLRHGRPPAEGADPEDRRGTAVEHDPILGALGGEEVTPALFAHGHTVPRRTDARRTLESILLACTSHARDSLSRLPSSPEALVSISIAVSDAERSAQFYERFLGAQRDTFDFGEGAVAFVGWPTFALNSARRPGQPGPAPESTSIQLGWWCARVTRRRCTRWSWPRAFRSSRSRSTDRSAGPS